MLNTGIRHTDRDGAIVPAQAHGDMLTIGNGGQAFRTHQARAANFNTSTAIAAGDLLVLDTANLSPTSTGKTEQYDLPPVTPASTANDGRVVGVAKNAAAARASSTATPSEVLVEWGYVPVVKAGTITKGKTITTGTTAGQAEQVAAATDNAVGYTVGTVSGGFVAAVITPSALLRN